MTGGGCPSSPAPASPLENEDLLFEILLRLPPAPSSLPRASLVCKLWRRVVSDPAFLRRFRARHRRSAPLLGFFSKDECGLSFIPALDPPDRIPPGYFSLQLDDVDKWQIVGSRHGLVLILHQLRLQYVVWDPVTGDQHHIPDPSGLEFDCKEVTVIYNGGAVLCPAGDVFQVVLVGVGKDLTGAFARVYSSDTGTWGNLISTECPYMFPVLNRPSTLVGGSLYWALDGESEGILEFDLGTQCLAVIEVPSEISDHLRGLVLVMRAEGGGLGVLGVAGCSIELWKRKTDFDGHTEWVLGSTIELNKLLSLGLEAGLTLGILGFAEDDNLLFLWTSVGVFMIQLESMQLKEPVGTFYLSNYHPFACVYIAGISMGGRQDGAELLQNV